MAAAELETTVTDLPESRVRVRAVVPPDEVERRVQRTAAALGREMRVPGFRKGKVPPPVVMRRVGREAVLDEAVRDSLGTWYLEALDRAGIVPVGDPRLDVDELPAQGEPLTFSIEIGVRPTARLGEYRGLEVGRREPDVSAEAVDAELERLRQRLARIETAERPAAVGDYLVIDFLGTVDGEPFAGGEGRDQFIELGAGHLVADFERHLVGAHPGQELGFDVRFPDDYRSEALRGVIAHFAVTVRDVKEKLLPDLDDDFASDAAGFDTLAELREDIEAKLLEAERAAIEGEFREAVLDEAVARARIEVPESLVHARAHEMWDEMVGTLNRQGISKETYLRVARKEEEELVHEAMPAAEQALRRESVLAAIVEAEAVEPTQEELLEAAAHGAEEEGTTPEKVLEQLRRSGRLEQLRRELAVRRVLDTMVAEAQPITMEQARTREKIWTPGKDPAPAGAPEAGRLWTPKGA